MASNSKVKLSAAVRKARRKPAEATEAASETVRAGTAPEAEKPVAAVAVAPLARCGGIVPALGRIVRRTAYGTLYGVTYTVVFPWALVR
ncbi:MAG: hypothetical protein PHT19_04000 [Methylococcus sp.]|nr:hypothetical protein [Methylococcus sp.]